MTRRRTGQSTPDHRKMEFHTLALILTVALVTPTNGLVGYDCGGRGLNITSLSLLNIGDCQVNDFEPIKKEVYIQLLQLSEFDHVSAIQCKIEIDRTIFYCGMHSHISAVHNGRQQYIHELSADSCKKLHETGTLSLGLHGNISGLRANATNLRALTFAGTIKGDGTCSGTQYSDPFGTWDDVIVQASIKITTRKLELPVKHGNDEVILPSGARCRATAEECNDADGTMTYWSALPADNCHFSRYDVLYEGIAYQLSPKKTKEQTQRDSPTIYTVTTQDTTFALAQTTETNVCGYKILRTEHPKLCILETQPGRVFKARSKVRIDNLDIFTYVNSKFIYVEKHLKTQLTQLYQDIMEQKCALERQILLNALSLTSIAPDEMAHRIMKSPGYTAVMAGEVIHLIKCVPVECRLRAVDDCYNELPVTYQNRSLFLLPRSKILTQTGTLRDCNELLPVMYQIHDTWYKMTPKPTESIAPPVIEPLTKPSWRYVSPDFLASSGIYTSGDLDRLRDHIMFPMEKPSMLNTIARGAMGRDVPTGSFSMLNLLDEESLDKLAESTGARLWKGFINFGSASAGVLGIFIAARFAKLVVDTLIHGYALHSVYGWSLHLLGAVWTSVTNVLLHLGRPREREQNNQNELVPLNSLPTTEDRQPRAPPQSNIVNPESERPSEVIIDHKSYRELRELLHEDK